MSRPLRIEYPGAWYHVMNRGRRGEDIFLQPEDYELFLEIVRETKETWNLKVAAYCLMTNHYHLLVQTPEGNLSRCMRQINGVYTQRFNRAHKLDGQLFRGRFKAVLVEEDNHLLEVMRYIHRNPLTANLCRHFDEYPWSSHHCYLSSAAECDWLSRKLLLTMLASEESFRKDAYTEFVSRGVPEEIATFYGKKKLSFLLGGDAFKERVKMRFSHLASQGEVTDAQVLAITPEEIIAHVCNFYRLDTTTLIRARRGKENLPRDIAIYLSRRCSRQTLTELGAVFGISSYSTVSSAIERIKARKASDSDLVKTLDILMDRICKGQGQT